MASGKLTPRQKMINLMYLVLIAMLALNMSKEVLTAFGIMNDKFVENNASAKEEMIISYKVLLKKLKMSQSMYSVINSKAKNISKTSNDFYSFLEAVKN